MTTLRDVAEALYKEALEELGDQRLAQRAATQVLIEALDHGLIREEEDDETDQEVE